MTRSARAELREVVEADVHREVGQLAVRLPQHPVLVVAEARWSGTRARRPARRCGPRAASSAIAALGQARVAHVALLVGPLVEHGAVVLEHAALALAPSRRTAHQPRRSSAAPPPAAPARRAHARRVARRATPRQLEQVLAGIAVLGQLGRLAQRLAQAHLDRARERLELVAGVVDVVLG